LSDIRVGVAGLGRMGRAIAERLAGQGFRVAGWTRSGIEAGTAASLGIAPAADLAALAGSADILVLSLFDDAAVTEVVQALCAGDLSGRLLVDTSTVGPETLRAERERIAAAGAAAVDAPVAGGPEMVLAGTASLFVGGEPADVARFMPVARAMAGRVLVAGGPGAGAAAKIVNNMMLVGYWEILKEALTVGRRAGLSYDWMLEMLAGGPAASAAFLHRLPVLRGETDAVGFTVDGVVKDTAVFAATAARLGVAAPAFDAGRASFIAHAAAGHGAADVLTMVRAACA
jgi:3-hydroxyisobutyrate dehydrogenase-like beta-hydroxyacid dehydrogenase